MLETARRRDAYFETMTIPDRGAVEVLASNLWFGSRSARELTAGTIALQALYSATSTVNRLFADPDATSELAHDIRDFGLYRESLRVMRAHLERKMPARVVLLGGGCAATAAVIPYLHSIYPPLRVVWLDAHGDLSSPPTSSSKYLHGMALRILVDPELYGMFFADAWHLTPDRVTLVGQKELEPAEREYIAAHGMELRPSPGSDAERGGDSNAPGAETGEVGAGEAGASPAGTGGAAAWGRLFKQDDREPPVYIHLDLDVLHPHRYLNPKCRIDAGLDLRSLEELLSGVAANARIVGYSIAENFETDPERVRRVVELLRSAAF